MHIKPTKIKTYMYTVWGLKYDDLRKGKTCDHGTSCQLKTLCLFYFVIESEKIVIMSGL